MNKYLVIIAFAFFHCVGPPEPEDGLIDNLSSIINTADVFSFSLRGDKYDFNESYDLSFFLDSNSGEPLSYPEKINVVGTQFNGVVDFQIIKQ